MSFGAKNILSNVNDFIARKSSYIYGLSIESKCMDIIFKSLL